jgi:hypothetical protein
MSLELHVFMKRESVPDRRRWQASIDALGLPLILYADLNLAKDTGFSPCKINGEDSGFEIFPNDEAKKLLSAYPHITSVVGDRDYVISFRWGGDLRECGCVFAAAAALVKSVDAVAYYPDDDIVYEMPRLLEEARQCF